MTIHKVVGFEFEFGSDVTLRTVKNRIQRELGISGLTVHEDCSVNTGKRYNGELVTPAWTMAQANRHLPRILRTMKKYNVKTDNTCGLHINMSFRKGVYNRAIDPLSLILMIDDIKWLKKFKRMTNTYCMTPKVELSDCLRKEARRRNITVTHLKEYLYQRVMMEYADSEEFMDFGEEQYIDDSHFFDKYFSVNLFKLAHKKPYVEFRFVGGWNYHKKVDDVLAAVEHISDTMDKSITERKYEAVKTRYIRKMLSPAQNRRIKTR